MTVVAIYISFHIRGAFSLSRTVRIWPPLHPPLFTCVMSHSSSPAQFIKKRIESLIEREYLARDKDDRRLYTYQAWNCWDEWCHIFYLTAVLITRWRRFVWFLRCWVRRGRKIRMMPFRGSLPSYINTALELHVQDPESCSDSERYKTALK